MSKSPFAAAIAFLLTTALVTPSVFFFVTPKAAAQETVVVIEDISATNIKTSIESTITATQSMISAALDVTNTAANYAQWVNAFILQPIAFVLSGNLMKALTAGVLAFVIGKANGTGAPQFAVDVMKSLQTVSDSQALAYINSFGRNSNSPFSYSISSALRTNYLSKTSLAGFWAANMNTLARSSPNQNAFLSGRWTQGGGVAAWFALTTRTENNPYTLYQASQSQLSTLVGPGVGGATGARVAQLGWGQGFMSWCGAREGTTEDRDGTAMEETTTEDNDGTAMEVANGVNPGDPCTDPVTGAPGTIKTPGSTIKATLDKVLGGQQDQIVRMGNVGPQINQILGNIATVMQTVQFASQILGGSDSGGLFGVGQASGANSTSRLMQYAPTQLPSGGFTSGYLGVSNSSVYQSAASSQVLGTNAASDRVNQYESAWNTIRTSAHAASTTVKSLADFCAAAADTAARTKLNTDESFVYNPTPQMLSTVHSVFIDAAREQSSVAISTLTSTIAPVLAQAAAGTAAVAAARAREQQAQAALTAATTETAIAQATADMQALQSMPPTVSDLANVRQEVQIFGSAAASPGGSLNISGGSLMDRMNLISTNAAALKTTVCNPSSPLYAVYDYGGA